MVWYEKLFICILLFLIGGTAHQLVQQYQAQPVVKESIDVSEAYRSVVLIKLRPTPLHPEYPVVAQAATGFAVSQHHILTVDHFCEMIIAYHSIGHGRQEIIVRQADRHGVILEKDKYGVIVAQSPEQDLCLLYSPDHGLTPLNVLNSTDKLQTGEIIHTVGAPAGIFPVTREGRIIKENDGRHLVLAVHIVPGSSGSPVLWRGQVAGIVVMYSQHLGLAGFATRANDIHDFLITSLLE